MAEEEKQQSSDGDERRNFEKEKRRPARNFFLSRTDQMVLDRERKDLFERDWSQIK